MLQRKTGFLQAWNAVALTLVVLCCTVPLSAQTPTFITFDAPDTGHRTNQGTFPTCISQDGVIAGYYVDSAKRGARSLSLDPTPAIRPSLDLCAMRTEHL